MRIGLVNPNFFRLAAIWRICDLEWVRVLRGAVRSDVLDLAVVRDPGFADPAAEILPAHGIPQRLGFVLGLVATLTVA